MSWVPGDLALCVKQGPWRLDDGTINWRGPSAGSTYRVWETEEAGGELFLGFGEWPYDWFLSDHFIKVTPGADIHGFEEPRRVPVKEDA